jgi:hypothetical protein
MDEKLKGLMSELGDAINGALSHSEEIDGAIQNVRNAGYDVFLILEATIGFNKKQTEAPDATVAEPLAADTSLKVTAQDLKFLRSLKISIADLNESA